MTTGKGKGENETLCNTKNALVSVNNKCINTL